MVAMQHNQWCMTSVSLWRRLFHDAAVTPSIHTGCHCCISCLYETARLTFTSPPPSVCLHSLHRFAPSCVLKYTCVNEPPAPSPLHLLCRHPVLCISLRKACPCISGCHSRSSFSINPSSYSHPQEHLFLSSISARPSCTHPLSLTSLHLQCLCWAVISWASLPCCIPFFPFAWLGLPAQHPHLPSPILFIIICSPAHCSGKSRQAVSSSCKSVFWLGSWSSAVPLEDDPVDENRGDGPGGAAGETEDRHPKHRWVITTGYYILLIYAYCVCLLDKL